MKESSFFWYDYETWGADPKTDRVAQFAGIRTDTELNIIGKPASFYCHPPLDRLPQPEACLVTGITPQLALEKGLMEAEFFTRIHSEFATPGTCTTGYNSLRFDDEFTRYGLYRNFFPPYDREWRNNNGRWDIIDMVRLTRALRPQGIQWPTRDDGAPSFRLESLTEANGITHQSAHDALSDVHATIALAKLIRDKQPKLYHYVLSHKDKRSAASLLDLFTMKPVLHVSGMFPAKSGSIAVVVPLTTHPLNKNGILVYDLSQDPRSWIHLPVDDIRHRLFTKVEELESEAERISLKTVHLNRCPVIVPINTLTASATKEWGIDLERCQRHLELLRQHQPLMSKLTKVFSHNPFPGNSDPEQALYEGFIPNQDQPLIEQVRNSSPRQLAQANFQFTDSRLGQLLFRYRARNWPETLNPKEQHQWHSFCLESLMSNYDDYNATLQKLCQDHPQQQPLWDTLALWPQQLRVNNE
jgi:exodeoxyribonuclease-1